MKSSCKITFEGLNVNRLLNKLTATGITIYSVERQGKTCVVEVPSSCSKQVIAILQEKCYNIVDVKYCGASAVAKFIRRRFILPIACLICIAVLLVSSQFCVKIEISGDFDIEAVSTALAERGVKVGSNLSRLDVDVLENSLANDVGAMYAVITRTGSVLYVKVIAKKEIEPPIDMTAKRDIVATRSGVVTSILCEQGTALVKVGDFVNIGDVLIEGKRLYNDGTSVDVYALGRVALEITATGFAEYNGYKTETIETGNVFKCTGVVLFGKEYRKACPFESYTVSTTSTRLFPLNLQICKSVFYETKTVTVAATIEECLDELKEKALTLAQSNCDFVVVDTQYAVDSTGVTATLLGTVEIE